MTVGEPADRGFAIDLPAGWVSRRDQGPFALLAQPANWNRPVSPTVAVVDVDSETATMGADAYLQAQFAGIADHLDDAVLLSVKWSTPGCLDLLLAHGGIGGDITTRQRHLILEGGRSLVASVSAADVDWPEMVGPLTATVASIRTSSWP